MTETYKYKAFISYSHRDSGRASWLHRSLEAYRVPRKLVGSVSTAGKVPRRVRPVFRDREDMSSATDLAETVKNALADAENLVVVCSPAAVSSHWVNEEIRQFAALGRKERIFCVIVDGDPGDASTDTGCFPAALEEVGIHEPLAADVRRWADGKHLSKLKLVAGMLGLPLDRLRRRDLQKRQRTWVLTALALAAVLAVLIAAISAQMAAEQRRDSGESLVAFKLNELRTILRVVDDPAELGRLKEWNKEKLARLIDAAGDGTLTESALGFREQGIDLWRKGELSSAMQSFQDSWALLAEAYRRNSEDPLVFFEMGQAEYWIGMTYLDIGAVISAEDSFVSYAEITRQLIILQPENAEWVLEMAYALSNLGALQRLDDISRPERALQLLQSALEYNQIALVLDPGNGHYQSELGQSHAFLADAQLDVCDLEGAFLSRQKQVALEREILATDRENTNNMKRLAWALSGLAVVQKNLGDVDGAIDSYARALQWMEPVMRVDGDTRRIKRFMLDRRAQSAVLKAQRGEVAGARVALASIADEWQEFFQVGEKQDENIKTHVAFLLAWARFARADGQLQPADALVQEATSVAISLLEKLPGERDSENLLMETVYQAWAATRKVPDPQIMERLPDYRDDPGRTRACLDASLAAKQAIMLGDTTHARELVSGLLDKDYTEVSFMHFCREHSLCDGG